ncbi:MAG: peptidoglycan editing factor PgeF [Betaproteobacteria bacterium]|nr:peptidoglycan editing factor PgeF [Betaproteobacteria bacterium]
MLEKSQLIVPDWPAPAGVRAFFTTRVGGVSEGPFASLNLGLHVGDDPALVAENRARVRAHLPDEPVWLNQVHGSNVVNVRADTHYRDLAPADAAVSDVPSRVCSVMVADCLPVLFCDTEGKWVGAAHAGWRGLAAGVLERTTAAMPVAPSNLMAWLGPAIGPTAFEVGQDVVDAFVRHDPTASSAFKARVNATGKYLADIYTLARQRLNAAGVNRIYGGDFCTVSDTSRFFSYRRDGKTGRMAGLIWIDR